MLKKGDAGISIMFIRPEQTNDKVVFVSNIDDIMLKIIDNNIDLSFSSGSISSQDCRSVRHLHFVSSCD